MPAPKGNFDKIISQQVARGKENSKLKRLKRLEESMEPLPKKRPRVLMEKDKMEYDYPETRKYNYVRPNSPNEDERMAPDAQEKHFPRSELSIPKKKFKKVADEEPSQDQLDESDRRRRDWEIKNKKLVPLVRRPGETLHKGEERANIVKIGDDPADDEIDFESWEALTPEEEFNVDAIVKGQNHPGNKTLHRGMERAMIHQIGEKWNDQRFEPLNDDEGWVTTSKPAPPTPSERFDDYVRGAGTHKGNKTLHRGAKTKARRY